MTDIQACWLVNKNITVIESKISCGRHNFQGLMLGGSEKMSLRALVLGDFPFIGSGNIGVRIRNRKRSSCKFAGES